MKIEFSDLKSLLVFNIKYYRYLNGLSQERLAEMCNLSPRYLTDIERGLHSPTIQKMEVIAKCLNIEPYQLLMNPTRNEDIINKINSSRQYNQKSKH